MAAFKMCLVNKAFDGNKKQVTTGILSTFSQQQCLKSSSKWT